MDCGVFKWCFYVSIVLCFYSHQTCNCSSLDKDEITRILQTSLECHNNPAMAVAVVKDGELVYSNGFGVTDIDTKENVTDETLFGIASISKSFAAALLVKLLNEDPKLTLDSKVKELLGDDFVMPDRVRTELTTFEDLLSHRTAMLANNKIRLDPRITRENLLSRLHLLKSNRQFRVDFIYSNLMYGLISRISEIMGKKKWEDLISEHLFQPLEMSKSTFATKVNFSREDLAKAYTDYDGPRQYKRVTPELSRRWAQLAGSGSVVSSVKDMAKWMNFHIFNGKNDRGQQVMEKKLVEDLHKPRVVLGARRFLTIKKPEFPITTEESKYALALRVGHYRGYELVTHTGSTYGYSTYMTILPTQKIGVITLLTGGDNYFRQRAPVQFYLMDKALGVEPFINSSTICTYPRPWNNDSLSISYRPKKTNTTLLRLPLQQYEGTFSNEAFGTLVIKYNSTIDSLVATYGWGYWEMFLWPTSTKENEERFYAIGLGPIFAPDMRPMYTVLHPDADDTVVGIRAPAFDSKMPPFFCKSDHMTTCRQIESKLYPRDETIVCDPSGSVQHKHSGFIILVFASISLFFYIP